MSMTNSSETSSSSPSLDPSALNPRTPRSGSASAPVSLPTSSSLVASSNSTSRSNQNGMLPSVLGLQRLPLSSTITSPPSPARPSSMAVARRRRSSEDRSQQHPQLGLMMDPPTLGSTQPRKSNLHQKSLSRTSTSSLSSKMSLMGSVAIAQSRSAQKINDAMVYLDGPQIYTCSQCRTHLTSHDEIISKSFHGRHGRAYLFDNCVNVSIGPPEDRLLITGLHSVCDIFCKRCNSMVGWTYARAYETSQKYKEGKFIVEKINLHLEESDYYDVAAPAGERTDRFRARSISWGSDCCPMGTSSGSVDRHQQENTIYEYRPSSPSLASASSRFAHG